MKVLAWLVLFYLMAEFGLLFIIGRRIGFFSLLGLMRLSAIFGLFLLKKSKLAGLLALWSQRQNNNTVGLFELFWPVRFILAGILLILPGFISDVFALLLLLPIKGPQIKVPKPSKHSSAQAPHFSDDGDFQAKQTNREPAQGDVIDVEYVKVNQKESPD